MEPYFEEYFFVETMVVLPKYLTQDLHENLRLLLTQKYPTTYQNKGYIFNIKVDTILDNNITLSGQIILKIKFKSDIYVPKAGHIFQGTVKKSMVNKHQRVEITPLVIFLNNVKVEYNEGQLVTVQITNVKVDNTLCFGKIL